jgi:hypothetical protein
MAVDREPLLESLQLPDSLIPVRLVPGTVAKEKAARKGRTFTIVPNNWRERLAEAHLIATYRLALLVLHQHWKGGGKPFTLSNGMAAREGVGQKAKWRGLAELEQLGLITLERRKRRSPRVTALANHGT